MSFWVIGCLMVMMAVVPVCSPLRAQAGSRKLASGLLLLIPLTTGALYWHLGAPAILQGQEMIQARGRHDVDGMLKALEAKLQSNPNDAQGWFVLGRSYLELQRTADAAKALARAVELAPDEASFRSHYAEALALGQGGLQDEKVSHLIESALASDPQDEKALELAGLAAFQREQWAQAAMYWRRLLKRLPAQSEFHDDISRAVQQADERATRASGLGERVRMASPASPQARRK